MAQTLSRRWWNWIFIIDFYDGYYYYVGYNWGWWFIFSIKYLLGAIIFCDFIYTVIKICKGSKSKFALSLMPFTLLYAGFLVISLYVFGLIQLISVGTNALVALQSWIFAMNYLRSYLTATKEPSSSVFRTH